ncbi:hypothetical protein MSAN_02327100 [Mycena sanguinolenta]|uniref:Uncharacterized protein n=1 Tax=Mycena sanguinolenta TaxID=230812 RepID=A0A8H6X8C1_9AGAR|nr:hypothetical protein MSAN_02327100 [Mycena sanguinolenta]
MLAAAAERARVLSSPTPHTPLSMPPPSSTSRRETDTDSAASGSTSARQRIIRNRNHARRHAHPLRNSNVLRPRARGRVIPLFPFHRHTPTLPLPSTNRRLGTRSRRPFENKNVIEMTQADWNWGLGWDAWTW